MSFVGVLIMILGKNYITTPRLGLAKFGPARMMKWIKIMGIIALAVIITVCVFWLGSVTTHLPKIVGSIIIAVMVAGIFGAMAYYLEYLPLALYGLLFGMGEILWTVFGESVGLMAMLIFGSIILIFGLFMLGQFLHKYPLPKEEVANGI